MKCPFCAEEIQDAAILCRFCGAKKFHGSWQEPPPPVQQAPKAAPRNKINMTALTMKSTGVLLIASGVFELFGLRGEIPLFGAMRGGAVAVFYHLLYIALFAAMGIALLQAKQWGYRVVMGGIGFYILDKVIYLLDEGARAAELAHHTKGYGAQIYQLIDRHSIDQLITLTTLALIACWVGFGLYVYVRRAYFSG